jgi:hypothetical protein
MSKCPFSNLLGIPGQGVHSMRFGGYAVVDTVLTVIAAYLTSQAAQVPFITSLLLWFFVGELMHITYGVQTAFLTALGIDVDC